jgi:hypothetical protein
MDFLYAICPGLKCSVVSPGVNRQVKGLIYVIFDDHAYQLYTYTCHLPTCHIESQQITRSD